MNPETDFIKAVHRKIQKKKEQRTNYLSIGLMLLLIVSLSIFQNNPITENEDDLWSLNEFINLEVFEWEYPEELTTQEILEYLIDGESPDEFIEFADNNEHLLQVLNSTNWENEK